MKNFLLGALATLVIVIIAALVYFQLGLAEVRADLPPSQWETRLMTAAVHASIKREAPDVPNPFPPTDENLVAGAKFYLDDCSGCHGTPGKPFAGNGPVLFPAIPELPVVGTDLTEAQIFFVAKHGIRRSGMFANGSSSVTDRDLWTVATYVKRMSPPPGRLTGRLLSLLRKR